MNLREHKNQDDMKCWLSDQDVTRLLEATTSTDRRLALALGARCGLRSHEVLNVAPGQLHETDAGWMLSVPEGKGDKYRETPVPSQLATQIETVGDIRDEPDSAPLVSITTTQSLRNWIKSARETVATHTEDERWHHVSFHDLRRSWATSLASKDVDPLIVCDWGGWNDLDTFLEHYRGAYSPEAQRREREKVDWL